MPHNSFIIALVGAASLDFDPAQYGEKTATVNGENIPYVANPVDAAHQAINIYIPAAYYNGGNITAIPPPPRPSTCRTKSAATCPPASASPTPAVMDNVVKNGQP